MALLSNMILIPEGWESVDYKQYNKAIKTLNFASTLLFALDAKDSQTTSPIGRSLKDPQVKEKKEREDSKSTSPIQPTKEKVSEETADGARSARIRDILTRALLHSGLVINAYELTKQKKKNIKIISSDTMLSVLANTPPTLLEQLQVSIRIPETSYVLIKSDLSLATMKSLAKELGLESPKRNRKTSEAKQT